MQKFEPTAVVRSAPSGKLSRRQWIGIAAIAALCCAIPQVVEYVEEWAWEATEGLPMDDGEIWMLDKAADAGADTNVWRVEIVRMADDFDVPHNWLMAVMHMESKFAPDQKNLAGSGATGLIQWMPETARSLGTTTSALAKMSHEEQLPFVEKYLELQRARYGGFFSFTDLYLAILYPKARPHLKSQNFDFILFGTNSKSYNQNAGLDFNKDGKITVRDVSQYLHKKYTKLYQSENP